MKKNLILSTLTILSSSILSQNLSYNNINNSNLTWSINQNVTCTTVKNIAQKFESNPQRLLTLKSMLVAIAEVSFFKN